MAEENAVLRLESQDQLHGMCKKKASLRIRWSRAVFIAVIQAIFSILTVIPKGLSELAAAKKEGMW